MKKKVDCDRVSLFIIWNIIIEYSFRYIVCRSWLTFFIKLWETNPNFVNQQRSNNVDQVSSTGTR
jgi:hypothetical protein